MIEKAQIATKQRNYLVKDQSVLLGIHIWLMDYFLATLRVADFTNTLRYSITNYSKYFLKIMKMYHKEGALIQTSKLAEINRVYTGLVRLIHSRKIEELRGDFDDSERILIDKYKKEGISFLQNISPAQNIEELPDNIAFLLLKDAGIKHSEGVILNNEISQLRLKIASIMLPALMKISNKLRISGGIPLWLEVKQITIARSEIESIAGIKIDENFQLESSDYYPLLCRVLNCAEIIIGLKNDVKQLEPNEIAKLKILHLIEKSFIAQRVRLKLEPSATLFYAIEIIQLDYIFEINSIFDRISTVGGVMDPLLNKSDSLKLEVEEKGLIRCILHFSADSSCI